MPEGLQSGSGDVERPLDGSLPEVSVCRSRPGKVVFIESDNSDGWIATDSAVELSP